MSKLSPMGQSMSALFSTENSRQRASQKDKPSDGSPNFKVPGKPGTAESSKPDDSLGNPNSPGYESWKLKKQKAETEAAEKEKKLTGQSYTAPLLGPQIIRLGIGWEKILMTQKKICEKAKKLFTALDAETYQNNRRVSLLKSQGCIVDLDIESHRREQDAKTKAEKKDDKDPAA